MENMERTLTLRVDTKLAQSFKAFCAANGTSMKSALVDYMEKVTADQKQPESVDEIIAALRAKGYTVTKEG